jgi:hypothetical protein
MEGGGGGLHRPLEWQRRREETIRLWKLRRRISMWRETLIPPHLTLLPLLIPPTSSSPPTSIQSPCHTLNHSCAEGLLLTFALEVRCKVALLLIRPWRITRMNRIVVLQPEHLGFPELALDPELIERTRPNTRRGIARHPP